MVLSSVRNRVSNYTATFGGQTNGKLPLIHGGKRAHWNTSSRAYYLLPVLQSMRKSPAFLPWERCIVAKVTFSRPHNTKDEMVPSFEIRTLTSRVLVHLQEIQSHKRKHRILNVAVRCLERNFRLWDGMYCALMRTNVRPAHASNCSSSNFKGVLYGTEKGNY